MKKILQKESPVLRDISKDVPIEEIGTPKMNKILLEMNEALKSQDDGVAIAAPQIGYPLRIFIISHKVERILKEAKGDIISDENVISTAKDIIFINPVIKKMSKKKKTVEEGCLSVRYLYGKVSRSDKVTIEAYDEHGKKFTRGGVGLMAQIFQHETDHLNGILFIDKAKYIEEIIPEHLRGKVEKVK